MLSPQEAKAQFKNYASHPFRQFQEEAIDFVMGSRKKFKILEAPTGSGKTIIAFTSLLMAGGGTYQVHSKVLQSQVTEDIPEGKSLFGRSNYQCVLNPDTDCSHCVHTKQSPCSLRHKCKYVIEKNLTLAHKLRILNYSYFLAETSNVGQFSGIPFAVVDEADGLESELINFVSLSFSERSLTKLGMPSRPEFKTTQAKNGIRSWIEFGTEAMERAKQVHNNYLREINGWDKIEKDWQLVKMREAKYFNNIVNKSKMFIENVDESWLLEEKATQKWGTELVFRPLWMTEKLSEMFFFRHAKSWTLMSASFLPLPILCKTLGIPIDEVDYHAAPSTFPIERRQIHIHTPDHLDYELANLTAKTTDDELPKLIHAIKTIMDYHKDEAGLIHCVSYKLGQAIMEGLKSPRIKFHSPDDKQSVLDTFVALRGDSVLLSPSSERGLSLDGDKCRFIIIAKFPYLNLGDRITSSRVYSGGIGQQWYLASGFLSALQMLGRGMRSESDFCTNYILDANFLKEYTRHPSMWPAWLRDAVAW